MRFRTWFRPRLIFCAFAAVTLGSTTPADADVLTINASGTIASSCSLAAASAFGTPNLTASGNVGATATVNCNSGFTINATSLNGGMKTTKSATGFASLVPYSLTVLVPLETTPATSVSATCAATTLVSGQSSCALSPGNVTGLSSGGKASLGKTATLTLAYTVPSLPTRLIAGSYSDTISLTITAVP